MTNEPRPLHIDLDRERGMTLSWDDGSAAFVSTAVLRRESPSADARELRAEMSRNPFTVLPASKAEGPLRIDAVEPVACRSGKRKLCQMTDGAGHAAGKPSQRGRGFGGKDGGIATHAGNRLREKARDVFLAPGRQFDSQARPLADGARQPRQSLGSRRGHHHGAGESRLGGPDEPCNPVDRVGRSLVNVVEDEHRRAFHERIFAEPVLQFLPGPQRLGTAQRIERQSLEHHLDPVSGRKTAERQQRRLGTEAAQAANRHRSQVALAAAFRGRHQPTPLPLFEQPFHPRKGLLLGTAGMEGGRLQSAVEGGPGEFPVVA